MNSEIIEKQLEVSDLLNLEDFKKTGPLLLPLGRFFGAEVPLFTKAQGTILTKKSTLFQHNHYSCSNRPFFVHYAEPGRKSEAILSEGDVKQLFVKMVKALTHLFDLRDFRSYG